MLTNILKSFRATKRDFFQLSCVHVINKYGEGGAVRISKLFGPRSHVASQRVVWKGIF